MAAREEASSTSETVSEEPVRKRQRRNVILRPNIRERIILLFLLQAIRPYSEETRAIRAMADEYHLRTAIDIMHSLSVEGNPDTHRIHSDSERCQSEESQPILTTAVYADNNIVLDPIAVVFANEETSLMIAHPLANIFPPATPLPSGDERDEDDL
jgi:hypothetical protein